MVITACTCLVAWPSSQERGVNPSSPLCHVSPRSSEWACQTPTVTVLSFNESQDPLNGKDVVSVISESVAMGKVWWVRGMPVPAPGAPWPWVLPGLSYPVVPQAEERK